MSGARDGPERVKPIPVRIDGGLGGRLRFALRRFRRSSASNHLAALLRPSAGLIWRAPVTVILAPVAGAFLIAAHLAIALRLGSVDDPLGYSVLAKK